MDLLSANSVALARIVFGSCQWGPAGAGGWDKAKSWGTEVRRGKSVGSAGEGNRAGEAAQGVLLWSWG